jgi:hypothetical protein
MSAPDKFYVRESEGFRTVKLYPDDIEVIPNDLHLAAMKQAKLDEREKCIDAIGEIAFTNEDEYKALCRAVLSIRSLAPPSDGLEGGEG